MKKFKNPFGDLFSSIRDNSDAIMRIQLNQIQNQFTKLSRAGRHHDALALAAEFAPNIRVNCIAPSLTNSKMSNFLLKNEKVAEGIAKMHPLKRIGEGSDTASVARFLLTKESSWITGQIIGVDGGRSSVA